MVDNIVFVYCLIVLFCGGLMILSQIFLRLTLDRRIRKELPYDKEYDCFADWYYGFFRVNCFAFSACFDWANNSWLMRDYYENFDVRKFASQFEKILSFILVLSGLMVVSSGIIVPLLGFFGYI